jgi:hypothetical protein
VGLVLRIVAAVVSLVRHNDGSDWAWTAATMFWNISITTVPVSLLSVLTFCSLLGWSPEVVLVMKISPIVVVVVAGPVIGRDNGGGNVLGIQHKDEFFLWTEINGRVLRIGSSSSASWW